MLCKKQSAIIIAQTNLLLKNWLWLHSGSGPSLEKSTPAPLLFSKIIKTPAGVYSDTPAPVHLWYAVDVVLMLKWLWLFNCFAVSPFRGRTVR